ncbi:MAG: DM13 domain-containing protein, partial [Myxococcota bacterium]
EIAAGQELFNRSCVVCHGMNATGTLQAPPLIGSLLEPELIARRVRTSGLADSGTYDGLTGGRMPFWGANRLSDDELRDLIAFVDQNEPMAPETSGSDDGPAARECDATHPRVGQIAELSTLSHGVMGTARIIDDCTIEITSFFYDGNGIDVRVYGGRSGNYDAGFAMTGDLLRNPGYENETIIATVPEGLDLDDLDGISIWCVAVGVSFGDGIFREP